LHLARPTNWGRMATTTTFVANVWLSAPGGSQDSSKASATTRRAVTARTHRRHQASTSCNDDFLARTEPFAEAAEPRLVGIRGGSPRHEGAAPRVAARRETHATDPTVPIDTTAAFPPCTSAQTGRPPLPSSSRVAVPRATADAQVPAQPASNLSGSVQPSSASSPSEPRACPSALDCSSHSLEEPQAKSAVEVLAELRDRTAPRSSPTLGH
jgi:hypothetical protein